MATTHHGLFRYPSSPAIHLCDQNKTLKRSSPKTPRPRKEYPGILRISSLIATELGCIHTAEMPCTSLARHHTNQSHTATSQIPKSRQTIGGFQALSWPRIIFGGGGENGCNLVRSGWFASNTSWRIQCGGVWATLFLVCMWNFSGFWLDARLIGESNMGCYDDDII